MERPGTTAGACASAVPARFSAEPFALVVLLTQASNSEKPMQSTCWLWSRASVPYLSRLRFGALFFLCAAVIVAALILGGGARSGYLSDIILQLLALPLLIAGLWRLSQLPSEQLPKGALIFCAALALLPLVQLIPLPPAIWTALPNRQPETEVFELLGRDLPWLPISVSPTATWLSALSLLVPVSIFLGTSLLDYRERRWLSLVIIGVTLVSIFLGLSQVSQSPSGSLPLSDVSTPNEAVGFFANRNHFAALLYSVTLFAAVWTLEAALAAGAKQRRSTDATTIVAVLASFTVLVMLVAGQMVARSRAGLALTIVALVGAFVLAWADRRRPKNITPCKDSRGFDRAWAAVCDPICPLPDDGKVHRRSAARCAHRVCQDDNPSRQKLYARWLWNGHICSRLCDV